MVKGIKLAKQNKVMMQKNSLDIHAAVTAYQGSVFQMEEEGNIIQID